MSTAVLSMAGAVMGAGIYAAAYAMRRPTLIERLTPRPVPVPRAPSEKGWARRLGHRAGRLLALTGIPGPAMVRTLAVSGTSVESYRAEKAAAAGIGIATATVLAAAGITISPYPAMVWPLAVLVAVAGFCAPDLAAHSAAAEHRGELRATASVLADLVVMGLAAGAGTTGAVTAALQYGNGRTPERIRRAVRAATLRHRPAWEGLETLARETGVRELAELAASLHLGGTCGAHTRTSLTAKATSLRARRLAETEAAANAATERMTLPTMGLVAGFLTLISYAALTHVTAGF